MEDENVASVVDAERAAYVETFTAKFPDTDGLDGFSHAFRFYCNRINMEPIPEWRDAEKTPKIRRQRA